MSIRLLSKTTKNLTDLYKLLNGSVHLSDVNALFLSALKTMKLTYIFYFASQLMVVTSEWFGTMHLGHV